VTLRAEAPAKINRELRVGGVRPDGHHEIRSRLVSIDLADRLSVERGPGFLDVVCEGIPVPNDESNLVVLAARALAERVGRAPDARILLEKRIPVGAGLGGGSSDAARTLFLLSRLWESSLGEEELDSLAASLGSDVPYFLTGGEADVEGRGERVTPLPDSPSEELLLLVPPFGISTAEVYAAHRRRSKASDESRTPAALEVVGSQKFFGPNDLAFAVLETNSVMRILLESAFSSASECAITGSGSTIVLRGAARDAGERLGAMYPEAQVIPCRTLSRAEYRVRTESLGGSQWRSPR
jgi:4-diphosphocytidyl-2-C-methyl-D-erythritol kinase